jgi:hypothetical protein
VRKRENNISHLFQHSQGKLYSGGGGTGGETPGNFPYYFVFFFLSIIHLASRHNNIWGIGLQSQPSVLYSFNWANK